MELKRITDHVYYSPHEERRDRPVLGYVHGKRCSVMVDAGASAEHTNAFYDAVSDAGLPMPEYTAITHWHWDHTLGMCAVKGRTIAHRNTQPKLLEMRDSADIFCFGDDRMRAEYPVPGDIVVALPDILFESELVLNLGGIHCHIIKIPSPHSDDSTAIWLPEEKALFLGDAASPDYFNGGLYGPEELHKMINWLDCCDFETCLLGHAEPLLKTELMEYLHSLGKQMP